MDTDLPLTLAGDPTADPAALAELAHRYPALRATIAGNPNAYPALLDWLAALGDPKIDSVLMSRIAAEAMPSIARSDGVVWRGYAVRKRLGAVGLGLGLSLYALPAFIPNAPFYGLAHGQYGGILVVLLIAIVLAAAIAVLPTSPVRSAIGALIVTAAVIIGFGSQETIAVMGFSPQWFTASNAVFVAGISAAWLVARARPPLSWLALIPLVAVVALSWQIDGVAYRAADLLLHMPLLIGYYDNLSWQLPPVTSNIFHVVVPVLVIIGVAALLDPKRAQRELRV